MDYDNCFYVIQGLRSTISNAKTDVQSMQTNCQEEADNLGTIRMNIGRLRDGSF